MDLLENPFYTLDVSARSTKSQIIEACDERSLLGHADRCTTARATLLSPAKRLAAELSWFPGLAPARTREFVAKISAKDQSIWESLGSANGLVFCNLATGIINHGLLMEDKVHNLIDRFVRNFETIDFESLRNILNEDRDVAGFSSIQDVGDLVASLTSLRKEYVKAMMTSLDSVEDPDVTIATLIDELRADFNSLPRLLEDLVDQYEANSGVQAFLAKTYDNVTRILKWLHAALEKGNANQMSAGIPLLEKALRDWAQVARPIYIVKQARGESDERTHSLVRTVREVFVDFANGYALHREALHISALFAELFDDKLRFNDQISEDILKLEEIIEDKKKAADEAKQFEQQNSIDIQIGKDRLKITPKLLSYKGVTLRMDTVDRVRYGVYVGSFNGIRINHRCTFWIGSPTTTVEIECTRFFDTSKKTEERFTYIFERLWKLVCVRLVVEMLAGLSSGRVYQIGNVRVTKDGVHLPRHHIFSIEPYFGGWEDLTISNGEGVFVIKSQSQKRAHAELSYRDIYNVHILEAVMEFLWKDGNHAKLMRGEFHTPRPDDLSLARE